MTRLSIIEGIEKANEAKLWAARINSVESLLLAFAIPPKKEQS